MSVNWWSLPGPRGLVTQVCSELYAGKNVLLTVPDQFPAGLSRAVRESPVIRDLHWHSLRIPPDDQRHPLDWLWEEFVFTDDRPGHLRSVEQLLAKDELGGMIVWVDGLTPSCTATLPAFIDRFSQLLNGIAIFKRFQLCCVVPFSTVRSYSANVCCAIIDPTSHAGSIDSLTYATTLCQEKTLNRLEAQVAASVIANIALWDDELTTTLVQESLDTILSPLGWLGQWGTQNHWKPYMSTEQLRHLGLLVDFDGQPKVHSSVVAMRGEKSEISARVWRGQAGVLLPFIEERRRDFLENLRHLIALPFRTQFGDITDINDLEIGHLFSMFGHGYRIDSNAQGLLRVLRDMRNKLAHFNPVESKMFECKEIHNWRSILDSM